MILLMHMRKLYWKKLLQRNQKKYNRARRKNPLTSQLLFVKITTEGNQNGAPQRLELTAKCGSRRYVGSGGLFLFIVVVMEHLITQANQRDNHGTKQKQI